MKVAAVLGALAASLVLSSTAPLAAKPKGAPKPPAKMAHGDAKAGEAIFTRRFPNECKGCHKFGSMGGGPIGPDLTHAGKKRNAAWIQAKLKSPKKTNPKSLMPPTKGSDKELADMAAFLASQK